MPDKAMICIDCKGTFVLKEGEEKWYTGMGYTPPKRCKDCRKKRKAEREKKGVAAGSAGAAKPAEK